MTLSTYAKTEQCSNGTSLIDQGSIASGGKIEIRTSPRPSSPDLAATGTILATLRFSNPSFTTAINGRANCLSANSTLEILESGTAHWFRIYDRNNVAIYDGYITKPGENAPNGNPGDILIDETGLIEGGTLILQSLTASVT